MLEKIRVKNLLSLAVVGMTTSLFGYSLSNNIAQAQSKPKVVASHNIICDLVKAVAEDTIDLTCLIGANQDPHSYRPTPNQRKAIEEAQLILYGGYQLEPGLIKLIGATEDEDEETPQVAKIALYEQVVTEPIMAEHHEESIEHHHHEESEVGDSKPELEPDPHVWHNVENTVAMVETLESIFLQANPAAAEQYLLNSNTLTEQLWQLDAWIKEQIATIPEGQILVTTHDSLNYFVRAYNLDGYKTLQGLNADSPTASGVRELAAEIEQAGASTIFAESTKSDRVINNVARAANVELSPERLYVDGLGEANSYTEMMTHNTCAIVSGLGGECQPFAAGTQR